MRLTKAFGLAVVATGAAMAFIGTGTAMAQDEVALCKALETLCAKGNLWPSGTELLLLAKEPKFLGVLPISCEDLLVLGKTTAETGSPLATSITSAEFGKLPTPSLGVGCTGCPFGLKTEVHTSPFVPLAAQLKVSGVDEFKLLVSNFKLAFLCGSIKCVFSAHVESKPITHIGTHPLHPGANLPVIPIEATITVLEDTSGIGACGTSAVWDVKFVLYLAHQGASTGLAWPSLDKKA